MGASVWAGHQDVVQVYQDEGETRQHLVHEALESHSSVLQAEWQPDKLDQSAGCDDGGLLDVGGVDRYLVVALLQVELAEDSCTCQAACDVSHVW